MIEPHPPRSRRRGVPLRVSMVVGPLVLVMVGLVASGFVVTSAMRNSLIDRTDKSLSDVAGSLAQPARPPAGDDFRRPSHRPKSEYYVQWLRADGHSFVLNEVGTPSLGADPREQAADPHTVGSADGSGSQWRVIARPLPGGDLLILATKLDDVNDTVNKLIWLQFGVGSVVVILVGVAGFLLVRSSLRPLRRVEETAHAIADGDLNLRVPDAPPNTEVGSLSESLNVMLHQIRSAFAATSASESQARESEHRMRQFVADASHELRTPLTSIKGFSELYRQGAMPDAGHVMGKIESEAGRMGLLVEDLLLLARMDEHRPLERTPVDLVQIATEAVHNAHARAPERDISLRIDAAGPPPPVPGDAQRLVQVVSNLVNNALVHTPADTPIVVDVATRPGEAVLSVVDSGPGLPEADRLRVFERFYRADASRNRSGGGGSGLGLSIVAALVYAHGGRVGVDETPGGGATFWVSLPTN